MECLESSDNEPCISANVWLGADAPLTSVDPDSNPTDDSAAVPQKRPLETFHAAKDSASSNSTRKSGLEGEPPKQRQKSERVQGEDGVVREPGRSGASGGDALSRVSEAITRVVVSALFTADNGRKSEDQSVIVNSGSSSSRGTVDSGPVNSAGKDSNGIDAKGDDVLNQWLNPTEEIMTHGKGPVSAKLASWRRNCRGTDVICVAIGCTLDFFRTLEKSI